MPLPVGRRVDTTAAEHPCTYLCAAALVAKISDFLLIKMSFSRVSYTPWEPELTEALAPKIDEHGTWPVPGWMITPSQSTRRRMHGRTM